MKKYIMFVNNLSGIGGAELYILRKAKWLKSNKYEVTIVTGNKEEILLEELNKYNLIQIPELNFPPNIFTKSKRNNIIKYILSNLNKYDCIDEVFIESHQTSPALWAEMFANKINGNNIVYMLAPVKLNRKTYRKYFVDKLLRDEVAGCNESYLDKNFKIIIPNANFNNNYFNVPFDIDEIQDLDQHNNEENYDLNIFTISRVDKKYIKETIKQVSDFAKSNPNFKLKYEIYINVTSGQQYDDLKKRIELNLTPNLSVYLNGPVIPLNTGIFKDQDIFIGMGTSIINSSAMKVPALVIDYRNDKYYGFFGYNYFEFGTNTDKAKYDFSEAISTLINNEKNKEKIGQAGYNYYLSNYENNKINEDFISFMIKQKELNKDAFDISNKVKDIRDLLDVFLVRFFGISRAVILRKQLINILNGRKKPC